MSDAPPLPGPLAGLRILELANETGQFCGKPLGDLGADVVKIEPPGGEPNRRIGPFFGPVRFHFWLWTKALDPNWNLFAGSALSPGINGESEKCWSSVDCGS